MTLKVQILDILSIQYELKVKILDIFFLLVEVKL